MKIEELKEAFRTAKGPRHRRVAYLGELAPSDRAGWAKLQLRLADPTMHVLRQASLLDEAPEADPVPETAEIRLGSVRIENARAFGDVWLILAAWKALGLDRVLKERIPEGKEEISWTDVVTILVIGRVASPGSELQTAKTWYPQTALVDILGVQSRYPGHTRRRQPSG